MPPWNEEGIWYLEIPYHYNIGEENETLICPKRFKGMRCYICDVVKDLRSKTGEEFKALADKLRPRNRIFYNIVDLENPTAGVQVFGSGKGIFEDLIYYDLDDDWGDITSPTRGYDIVIDRRGTGLQSKYQVLPKRNPSAITNKEWLDQLNDLSVLTNKVLSYEELKVLYERGSLATSEEEDEEVDKIQVEVKIPKKDEIVAGSSKPPVATPSSPEEDEISEVEEGKPPKEEEFKGTVEEEKGKEEYVPGCFGLDFVDSDPECKVCDYAKDCGPQWKKAQEAKKRGRKPLNA
jgi:hypothetical protein